MLGDAHAALNSRSNQHDLVALLLWLAIWVRAHIRTTLARVALGSCCVDVFVIGRLVASFMDSFLVLEPHLLPGLRGDALLNTSVFLGLRLFSHLLQRVHLGAPLEHSLVTLSFMLEDARAALVPRLNLHYLAACLQRTCKLRSCAFPQHSSEYHSNVVLC